MRSVILAGATLVACSHSNSGAGPDSSVDIDADAVADGAASNGVPLPAKPHGVYVLNGQGSRIAPVFLDPNGPGFPYVKGTTLQVHWNDLEPNGPTFAPSAMLTNEIAQWRAAGKEVNLVFQATNYQGGNFMPTWYATPATIATLVQTAPTHVITITTTTPMTFFVGSPVNQQIQLAGTTGGKYDGVYTISSFDAATKMSLTVQGVAGNDGTDNIGTSTAGNPILTCAGGTTTITQPVFWSPNFIAAWENVISEAKRVFDDGSIGYMRFGMGIGGENSPIMSLSQGCQTELQKLGFTTEAPPWKLFPDPSWESTVASGWIAFQRELVQDIVNEDFATQIMFSLSPIDYGGSGFDYPTPDATAAFAVAAGFGVGNQGWRAYDATTYGGGGHCTGDYCALFDTYRGQVPLELQPTLASDPGAVAMQNITGDLTQMLPFAVSRGAQILELYADDLLCAFDPTFAGDSAVNPPYTATYAQCGADGYPAAVEAAAAAVN